MIYFVQPVDGGPVKIGTAVDVDRRIAQLEAHYKRPLALLATLPGDSEVETEIHERFDHLRLKRRNRRGRQPEQFRPAADLMAFIGRPLLVDPNPDAVEVIVIDDASKTLFAVKGSLAWNAWLKEFADSLGTNSLGAIDQCLRDKAEERGFKPMPKRMPRKGAS
jgi:hypothetical protein